MGLPSLRVTIVPGERASAEPQTSLTFAEIESRFPASQPAERCTGSDLALFLPPPSGNAGPNTRSGWDHREVVDATLSISRCLRPEPSETVRVEHPLASDVGLYQVFAGVDCGRTVALEQPRTRGTLLQQDGNKRPRRPDASERTDG
jgi:hypothetical protein